MSNTKDSYPKTKALKDHPDKDKAPKDVVPRDKDAKDHPHVFLMGAMNSLDIIPLGKLDLIGTDVYLRAATINGKLGIPIPIKGLKQKDVPAKYTLDLGA